MKITMIYRFSSILTHCILLVTHVSAQEVFQKLEKSMEASADIEVAVNANHTTLVFETWNKSEVKINAYIEGSELNSLTTKQIAAHWNIGVKKENNKITINSATSNFWSGNNGATVADSKIPDTNQIATIISNLLEPVIRDIKKDPSIGEQNYQLAGINFDLNAYRKDEEKYVQQWQNQIKEKFGNETNKLSVHQLNQLSKNRIPLDLITKTTIAQRSNSNFITQIYSQTTQHYRLPSSTIATMSVTKNEEVRTSNHVSRMVKVMIPTNASIQLNTRHGSVVLENKIKNIKASLAHTKLDAKEIDGTASIIKISYAPVTIQSWKNGRLLINYVKNCRIQQADNLHINSDSSNIFINSLENKAFITGNFGAITLVELSKKFSTLDLIIENSDFKLTLPDTALTFNYNGMQSRISLPKTMQVSARKSMGNVFMNGFHKNRDTDRAITIYSKYSTIQVN